MQISNLIKRWYIKTARYLLGLRYLRVMEGTLKGYYFSTHSSYEYILGNYEDPALIETFMGWLKPDTVFYDLGAHIGYYSLLANCVISTGKIYAFEPLPANRLVFEKIVALNKAQIQHHNIELFPFAVSDSSKELSFSNDPDHAEGNTFIQTSPVFAHAANSIMVKSISIDEWIKQAHAAPDIIKIDVEGAEYEVLKGAMHTLQTYKPKILLATHDCQLPGVKDQCLNLLKELGYTVTHTGYYNKQLAGLDDFMAIHPDRI